jgi:hypothetical protein
VNASTGWRRGLLRIGLVALLVVAAFFAALPWLGCLASVRPSPYLLDLSPTWVTWELCTTTTLPKLPTDAISIPGFTGPYWGNLILGVVYLIAAVYVTFTKRPL